ncbi:MAG: manganese efflux pump [Methanomicrobiales archaeon]|nr:manganese efflux pump [Methanomicrobiales archaeon]NYT20693.1 manganese efflux pump [Methanomicrobiales archaeon]
MDLSLVLLVGIGLAMDCFAVSLAAGTTISSERVRAALIIAACFGGFQALMALIGWLGGTWLAPVIAPFDHWAAFIILAIIGGKMILEGFFEEEERKKDYLAIPVLILLSVATSIDSLGVGLSLALISSGILVEAAIIGLVSLLFSFTGVMAGGRLASRFGKPVEIAGGIILILIGVRILAGHLSG